jgi:hypothetical protein
MDYSSSSGFMEPGSFSKDWTGISCFQVQRINKKKECKNNAFPQNNLQYQAEVRCFSYTSAKYFVE